MNIYTYKWFRMIALMTAMMMPMGVWADNITNATQLAAINGQNGSFTITTDIILPDNFTSIASFSGTLEANINPDTKMPYRIKNLKVPLFATLTGTVKNLVIEDVDISGHTGNTGAIACTANGSTRIYNVGILSGSVGGTGYTGGLVGLLDGSARVINCYSFANITGGSEKAGIVGFNNVSTTSTTVMTEGTLIMNCMFYGDIALGGSISPIYGGTKITNNKDNNGLNTYNYFRYHSPYSEGKHITTYNCALGADERYLKRFEFFRQTLNATRELAAIYATGSAANVGLMYKWVLHPDSLASNHPYPILKPMGKYPSVVNHDANNAQAIDAQNKHYNEGRKLTSMGTNGTLAVHIQMGTGNADTPPFAPPSGASITTSDTILIITDKNPNQYDFNYGKVQLPYYNEVGDKNYNDYRVVTGWKIVSVTGGAKGTYSTGNDYPAYNFADRATYAKDFYGTGGSNRIFAQGAYFNVPDGVTEITIEPYWAKCAYLSDKYYDRTYNTSYSANEVTQLGVKYNNGASYSINGNNQKVYNTMSNALTALASVVGKTVYDYAVVLVGNHRNLYGNTTFTGDNQKPVTIMSADLDFDNEPDYSMFYQHGKNRVQVAPLRFDFMNLINLGMTQKVDSYGRYPEVGIFWNNGWFEVTNTVFVRFGQFEYNDHKDLDSPLILLGGEVDQIVSKQDASAGAWHTNYILLGDNVCFRLFANGTHLNKAHKTPHRPISVTGGEYELFYLTGYFRSDVVPDADNAECYIDGGKFGEVAGAGLEKIAGNVTWKINHADIKSFYGGGINANQPITGDIDIDIKNSRIVQYCGGPKFGDMSSGKSVATTANNCTFGTYFGAGYGGTSLDHVTAKEYPNQPYMSDANWNTMRSSYNVRGYSTDKSAIGVNYDIEYFLRSGGADQNTVARFYVNYATMSLAVTHEVTSTLTNCIVDSNFYGGGNLGKVVGVVSSTLTDCKVKGSAFGAGYSATVPKAYVCPNENCRQNPYYDVNAGVFGKIIYPDTTEYTWKHTDNAISAGGGLVVEEGKNLILTQEDLTTLGTVSGNATLILKGTTTVGTLDGDTLKEGTGNVYGGGDESGVTGNTTVKLEDETKVLGNVYGGGNRGAVGGSSEVIIQDTPQP